MAIWDIVSKIENVPLYEYLAKKYGDGTFKTRSLFMQLVVTITRKDIQMLQDEMKSYMDLGFTTVKMKIGVLL